MKDVDIDDILGVAEAGYKSQELNAYINIQSALKKLQFNGEKCKTIIIGKNTQEFHKLNLEVDSWKYHYRRGINNNIVMEESYEGKIKVENVIQHKYF